MLSDAEICAITRPVPRLLRYYLLSAFVAGPGFPFLMAARYLRYRTLRYEISAEGVAVRWGAFFRQEVHLTYDRVQDIHLTSNVVERWFSLGRIQIQTASGSSKAEINLEGLPDPEAVREFLYRNMRGAPSREHQIQEVQPPEMTELAAILTAATAELRAVRETIASQRAAETSNRD